MIWFDLDNTPHVPLFRPIFDELKKRNIELFVTSRVHAQTEDLLHMWNVPHLPVGLHSGGNKLGKVLNLLLRSTQLADAVKGKPIALSMSHGSRSHLVASRRLGIPYIYMDDYEYSEKHLANLLANHILVPSVIPDTRLAEAGYNLRKIIRYAGLKEEIYLEGFVPDITFRGVIGVPETVILITLRPPSTTASYHDSSSEKLFKETIKHFSSQPNTQCLVVNRTDAELDLVSDVLRKKTNVTLLSRPVDGLQLLWNSDIVVSGGGTMNRESALLGVPTYSLFTGRHPYVDEFLEGKGKLTFIENTQQIDQLPVRKRQIGQEYHPTSRHLASSIADLVLEISLR